MTDIAGYLNPTIFLNSEDLGQKGESNRIRIRNTGGEVKTPFSIIFLSVKRRELRKGSKDTRLNVPSQRSRSQGRQDFTHKKKQKKTGKFKHLKCSTLWFTYYANTLLYTYILHAQEVLSNLYSTLTIQLLCYIHTYCMPKKFCPIFTVHLL